MRVIYTGKQEGLTAAQQKKIEVRLAKLGKLLDRKEEKEAHVILNLERHLHHAEITVNYYDHPLVGMESATDLFGALTGAIQKLEKQLVKFREKFRETRRDTRAPSPKERAAASSAAAPEPVASAPRIHRVNGSPARKPMTVDEALLEMEQDRDYLIYRDAETDRTSVLLRRRDGHFDLIES